MDTLAVQLCDTLLWDTRVGQLSLDTFWDTLRGTLLWDSLVGHFFGQRLISTSCSQEVQV